MASKPIPQLKRPAVPADIADRFIAAAHTATTPAVALELPVTPLTVVPNPVPSSEEPLAVEADLPEAADVIRGAESRSPPRRARKGRKVTKLASGEEVRKVTFYLPVELDADLGVHCVRNGLDRTEVVVSLLQKHLKAPQ